MNVRTSAAFDGNNNQDENNAASHNFAATTVTLGKDFGSGNAKVVNQVKAWGYSGGGFTSNASENCTITVIGSNTGLGSDEVTLATSGTISDTTDSNPQIISFSNSTAYRYVYIKLTQSPSNYFFVAELEFYEKVTVGFGTTGFLIEGGAAFTNGTDSSGNSQNFTKGGTITDVDDTLTDKASDNFGNYATLNRLHQSAATLSGGNLIMAGQGSVSPYSSALTTMTLFDYAYFEVKMVARSAPGSNGDRTAAIFASTTTPIGDVDVNLNSNSNISGVDNGFIPRTGGSSGTDPSLTWAVNDYGVFAIRADGSGGTNVFVAENGASNWIYGSGTTGNPVSNSNPTFTISGVPPNELLAGGQCYLSTDSLSFNFGQTSFQYTPPTGFKAVSTANLPAPTVTKPSDFFKTVLYTGNGSARTISGVGFQPDWVWIKDRNVGENHYSFDAVRGAEKRVHQNTTGAEGTESTALTGFVSDGFTLGDGSSGANTNTRTYAAWCWKAGDSNTAVSSSGSGSGATNACTHRANTTSGLSVIKYTGFNGTISNGEHTLVTHGLGSAPVFMMGRSLDSTQDWFCLPGENDPTGSGRWGLDNHMRLSTNDDASGSLHVQPAFPTSTAVKLGNDDLVNKNGDEFIMYAFIRVPGICAYGTYKGNGATDGAYVVVNDGGSGFRPAWVMIKNITSNGNWFVYDNQRNTLNVVNAYLIADGSATEATSGPVQLDFIANGFKLRSTNDGTNGGSDTYMYLAMAENPFGGNGVAQAKAR